jgi:hypothetical protein
MNMKIMEVTPCGFVGKCKSSPRDYAPYAPGANWRTPSAKTVAAYALQQLEAARAKDVEAHAANLPAIENNLAVVEQVKALMEAIGMPKSWSERDHKSRARYPKTITHTAGYLTDLQREVRTSDSFEHATSTYETLKKRYEEFAAQAEAEEARANALAEQEDQRKRTERRANLELAAIILRYALPEDSEWSDILDELRKRDQILDLAVAMQQTRGDWSEGPWRVRDALGRFQIRNDQEKDIAAGVAMGLIDFDDGRVFRDMQYSYGELFAMAADQQLSADVQLAASRVED